MNRAGTGLKNPDLDHRMEYFDPRTRPQAIFLDEDALLSTPPGCDPLDGDAVSPALVGAMAQIEINRSSQAARDHAFRLAHRAYGLLIEELDNPSLRTDLCIAAFLQNRAEDDGNRRFSGRRLFRQLRGLDCASCALSACRPRRFPPRSSMLSKIRLSEAVDARSARQVAEALDWHDGMEGDDRPRSPWLTRSRRSTRVSGYRRGCAGLISHGRTRGHRQGNSEELERQRGRALAGGSDRGRDAAA